MTPRRFIARYGVGLAILALASGIVVGFSQTVDGEKSADAANMPPPPEVSVAQVVSRDVRQWDEFTGRVTAVETVELRPRVSGYVERVAYEEGQEVRKGDLLFLIDQRSYRAAFDRARADVERARSEAKLAASEFVRAQTLVDARAISGEEFDARKAAATQGNAAVRAAEAALDRARLDLEFTEVRAPIDGRAGRAVVTVGNLAQADSTLLTTLVSLDPVHVYFEADEQTYLGYNELARRGERGESRNPVRVGLANETGYPHAGTLDFTDNQVDPRTGTIRARAVVPNPDRVFTPGLFARVQLEGSGVFHALLINDKAVLTDQDRKYVYVLGPGNTAVRRDIELGRVVEGLRVVSAGLEGKDKVIVHGVQKVFVAGMPVTPQVIAMGDLPHRRSRPFRTGNMRRLRR
jgi:membrane fusion protein, multidrug efflux system